MFQSGFLRAIAICFLTLAAVPAPAQMVRGAILGMVSGGNGPLVGAVVTVVETETNRERSASSDRTGEFQVAQLAAGVYRVDVSASGYRKASRTVVLLVNQEIHIDFPLTGAEAGERIEVKGEAGLLQTESSALRTAVENREIRILPLDGRNFYELTLLAPGAAPVVEGAAGGARGDFSFHVNGAREDSNSFLLDGVFNGDPKLNGFAIAPPVDAVREYEVLTSGYDASFGRYTGGQVNVVVKSGTNQVHGTAFAFLRNAVLDGTNYFAPKDASPKNIRNQFGGSVGGALRKDRTFYFTDYEGRRIREGITRTANVPTALERVGDFSRSGRLLPIDVFTQQPFPNLVIPRNRMSPVGLAIAALYPLPNRAEAGQNYVASPVQKDRDDRFDVRLDHRLGTAAELGFRYSFGDRDFYEPFAAGNGAAAVPGYGNNIPRRAQNAMLSETQILTPRLVNEMRLGFNRVSLAVNQENQGNNLNRAVGLPVVSALARDTGLTRIGVAGFSTLGDELNNPQGQAATSYEWNDNATWARGRHLVRFGAGIRHQRTDAFADVLSRGLIQFTGFTGNALAEMLQSLPSYSTVARMNNPQRLRTQSYWMYVQDAMRVRPNLTLTLGMRYEYHAPPVDPQDRAAVFDVATRRLEPVGKNGVPRAGYHPDRNNVAPRVGLAWTPDGGRRWTVRTGYGVYYEQAALAPSQGLFFSPPYYQSQFFIQSQQAPIFLENPFPANYPLFIPNSAFAFQRDLRTPYTQQWSFGIQRKAGETGVVEVSYVGTKGTKLINNRDINQARPSTQQPNLRPLPQYSDIDIYEARGNSAYHGLQAKYSRRLSKGLSALAGYTFAKSIDDASAFFSSTGDPSFPQDSNNVRGDRGLSSFDVRQRLTLSYSYDVPGGKHPLLRGWQTSGVWTFQTGRPFTVTLLPGVDNSNTGIPSIGFGVVNRPNLTGDPGTGGGVPERWFNTSAFGMPAFGSFGNAGRNILAGPGVATVNVSAIKNLAVGEIVTAQLRAEIFNLFDRGNFELPNAYFGSPSFGRVLAAGAPRRVQIGLKLIF